MRISKHQLVKQLITDLIGNTYTSYSVHKPYMLPVSTWCMPNFKFLKLSQSPMSLQVHPNHTKTSKESLKLFKLCGRIVGKCVFESAWGDQHLLNLKLTCSFFGLLLGLKPNYKVRFAKTEKKFFPLTTTTQRILLLIDFPSVPTA